MMNLSNLSSLHEFSNDNINIWLSALALVVSIAWLGVRYASRRVPVKGLPMAAGSHWYYGHSHFLALDFKLIWRKLAYENANKDGICTFWLGRKPCMAVTHAEHARAVLNCTFFRDESHYFFKHISQFVGKKSLVLLMGKEWKTYRFIIARAFTPASMLALRAPMTSVVSTLVKSLTKKCDEVEAKGETLTMNITYLLKMVTIDTFGEAVFGKDLQCCSTFAHSPVETSLEFVQTEFSRRMSSPFNIAAQIYSLPTAANRRRQEKLDYVRNFFSQMIHEHEDKDKKGDLLFELLQSVEEYTKSTGEKIDKSIFHEALIDNLITLYVGSTDNTATNLSYTLYCLAMHLNAQEKLLEEANRVLKDDPREIDYTELAYCTAAVTEGLRLYGNTHTLRRTLEKPMQLGDTTVPVGMSVFFPFWDIQRDERHFPRALEYLPERWVKLGDDGKTWEERFPEKNESPTKSDAAGEIPAADRKAFFAFSVGGRNCVGERMARQQATIILAMLVRKFSFEVVPGYKLEPVNNGFTQKAKGGIPMIIKKRI